MKRSFVLLSVLLIGVFVNQMAAAAELTKGTRVKVVVKEAKVMIGKKVLAVVKDGDVLTVIKTNGDWLGVKLEQDGKKVKGWILARNIAAVANVEAGPAPDDSFGFEPRQQLSVCADGSIQIEYFRSRVDENTKENEVKVIVKEAEIMLGKKILAVVKGGDILIATSRKGDWLHVKIRQGGQDIEGWILVKSTAPVASPKTRTENKKDATKPTEELAKKEQNEAERKKDESGVLPLVLEKFGSAAGKNISVDVTDMSFDEIKEIAPSINQLGTVEEVVAWLLQHPDRVPASLILREPFSKELLVKAMEVFAAESEAGSISVSSERPYPKVGVTWVDYGDVAFGSDNAGQCIVIRVDSVDVLIEDKEDATKPIEELTEKEQEEADGNKGEPGVLSVILDTFGVLRIETIYLAEPPPEDMLPLNQLSSATVKAFVTWALKQPNLAPPLLILKKPFSKESLEKTLEGFPSESETGVAYMTSGPLRKLTKVTVTWLDYGDVAFGINDAGQCVVIRVDPVGQSAEDEP